MDEHLKKRLVGAAVLMALAIIFIPMLLEDETVVDTGITRTNIPPRPDVPFTSRIQPAESTPAPQPEPIERAAAVPAMEAPTKPLPKPKAPTSDQPAVSKPAPAPVAVETAKPAAAPAALTSWVVQVGSFSKQENADKLIEEMKKAGFAAFREKVQIEKETLYRVRVGPEVDHKKAEQMQADIEKKFALKGRVEQYP